MRNLIAFGLVVCLSQVCFGEVTFQQGLNGYTGTFDSMIRGEVPNERGDTIDDISVDQDDGGFPTQGLIRFDSIFGNGPGQYPTSDPIESATLQFRTNSSSSGTISFHRMLAAWDNTATWAAFGGNGVQGDGIEAIATPTATLVSPASNVFHTIDVTADLRAFANGSAQNFGWVAINDSGDGWDFWSAEYTVDTTFRPMLTITAVPEPTGVSILGLSLIGLAFRRRRVALS